MNKSLFLVPSAYGLFGWLVAIFFVAMDPVGMQSISGQGYFIIAYTLLVFVMLTLIFKRPFANYMGGKRVAIKGMDLPVFAASTIIGLYSLISYFSTVAGYYGSLAGLAYTVGNGALDIRANAEEFSGVAVQLSYFSWLSIFLGAIIVDRNKYGFWFRLMVLTVILCEFSLNLIFVDRTRPIWIIFTTGLGLFIARGILNLDIKRNILYLFVTPVFIFLLFSLVVGKYNKDFGVFGTMSAYIVSGIGYLDDLSVSQRNFDYVPVRTFLPVFKGMEAMGLTRDVPSSVLDNRYIPFPTNVGTIHEPYFSDGGMLYIIIFFPIIVFFTNFIAWLGLRTRRAIGLFMWANCVFSMMISFFVPKFNGTTIYFCTVIFFLFLTTYRTESAQK